jgi:hypothetical protein
VSWNHGTPGLLFVFGTSAAGVLVGLLLGRAPISRILAFPLMAIPIFIVAALLWTAIVGPLQRTSVANLIPYLGFGFFCHLLRARRQALRETPGVGPRTARVSKTWNICALKMARGRPSSATSVNNPAFRLRLASRANAV